MSSTRHKSRRTLCQGRTVRACVHSVGMFCGYMPNSSLGIKCSKLQYAKCLLYLPIKYALPERCEHYYTTGAYVLEVCGSTISATRPVPVPDDAYPYPYPTRAENCYPTRPDPTRPAGIPVPVAYP